jgi:pyruvate/2-oxoglutarate/acetoin dehydrogenase E1 component
MYNDQVRLPLVIRTPMGGRRGYGPTHSQSLEKLYLGVPGLRVLSPCTISDPGTLLKHAILEDDEPVLFVENKLLYPVPIQDNHSLPDFIINSTPPSEFSHNSVSSIPYPTYTLTFRDAPPPILTLAAYGYMADLSCQAALRLAYEYEIITELIVPTQLAPFDIGAIRESCRKTRRLLVVEEGNLTLGWGAEMIARTVEANGIGLRSIRRLAGLDLPIPASGVLESKVLPGVEDIIQAARTMV